MFENRCKTEDHLIDPDATSQDSAQALPDEAPILARPASRVTVRRWGDTIERAETAATVGGVLSLATLATLLRAQLLDEMNTADALRAELAALKGEQVMPEKVSATKCSPVQMRRNLELVEVLKKSGMDFVPVPALNADDRQRLLAVCDARLALILAEVEKGEQ